MRILVIEDETSLRESLARRLAEAGYSVDTAAEGEEGLYAAIEHPLDAAIVDLGLPKLSGFDVIRTLRSRRSTLPVLVLTARKHWSDTVQALQAGADDYMHKPCNFHELVARIQALMRRHGGWASSELVCEPIALNLAERSVRVAGVPVDLTTFEYNVLEYLMLHAGQIVTKSELRDRLYDGDEGSEGNVLDVLILRLRRKLDPDGRIDPIQTVRGMGYRWRLPRTGRVGAVGMPSGSNQRASVRRLFVIGSRRVARETLRASVRASRTSCRQASITRHPCWQAYECTNAASSLYRDEFVAALRGW